MTEETLKRIENAVRSIETTEGGKKKELLALLQTLRGEVQALSSTHGEHARSIAGFAELAAHEAARKEKTPEGLEHALKGLTASAKKFEATHLTLVQTIDGICVILARMGI
ncbi:MAG: DUF4404 family protein [Elusimicrobiota bacterium]|jgi:hypothetical protein